MKQIIYHDKVFPSQTSCIQFLGFTISKINCLAQNNNLTIIEALDVAFIKKFFHLNIQTIISCSLYKNEKFLIEIDKYVKTLKWENLPKKRIIKKMKTTPSLQHNSKPFTYKGIYYHSALEYCKKHHIKYIRLMKYINRKGCTTQNAIDALKKIDERKKLLAKGKKFNINTSNFSVLEKKYGEKFYYYLNALVKENLQDKFTNLSLKTFLRFAISINLKNTRYEMENFIDFIIKNDLNKNTNTSTELYKYNGIIASSIRNLCEKLNIPYVSVMRQIEKQKDYKEAITYVINNSRIYEYKGKTYHGFSNLCKDYNIPLTRVLYLSTKKKISKMDAFLQLMKS